MAIEIGLNGKGKIRKGRARHGSKTMEKKVGSLREKKENESKGKKKEEEGDMASRSRCWRRATGVHWMICFALPAAV